MSFKKKKKKIMKTTYYVKNVCINSFGCWVFLGD